MHDEDNKQEIVLVKGGPMVGCFYFHKENWRSWIGSEHSAMNGAIIKKTILFMTNYCMLSFTYKKRGISHA